MAKAKTLAALAGLAGLAYAMRDKSSKDDAGDQKTSAYTGDIKKVGALEDTFKPTNESAYALSTGVRPGVGDATNDSLSVRKIKPSVAPVLKTSLPKIDPRDRESGMSRGTSSAESPSYSNEGRSSIAPTVANRSDQLTNISRATKREAKTKQFADDVPYQESAQKTDALSVASRAARASDARRRMAQQGSYKSGGMTASKRADGIASRGKTRGKIC